MADWLSTLSGVGMAVGPPAVYLDQFINIIRIKSSAGFSIDICGVLIIANTTRVFYWFAERFETALLAQSILMILAQFGRLPPSRRLDTLRLTIGLPSTSLRLYQVQADLIHGNVAGRRTAQRRCLQAPRRRSSTTAQLLGVGSIRRQSPAIVDCRL